MADIRFELTIVEQVNADEPQVRQLDDLTGKEITKVLNVVHTLEKRLQARRMYLAAHRPVRYIVAYRGIGGVPNLYLRRKDPTTIVATSSFGQAAKFSLDEALELLSTRQTHDKRHGPAFLISDQIEAKKLPTKSCDDDLDDDDDDDDDDDWDKDDDYFDPPSG